jgi:SAM-dependent methyltransferase
VWPVAVTDVFARRATLSRSVRLLSAFRYEQPDPARFYGALATDTAAMVGDLWLAARGEPPTGRTLLDVGGGPGYFAQAFADADVRYLGVEPDPSEMHAAGPAFARATDTFVRASGMALPFADDSVDICLSSNVAEHVPRPWQLGAEMLRVTKPGGLAVLSYTVWLGPFGGHEMGLTHYLGGARAAARYARKERLRVVVVCGVRRRGAELGRKHRGGGGRIPALPPAMGVVADVGAGAARVPGQQSRAGAITARMKHVLVLLRLG